MHGGTGVSDDESLHGAIRAAWEIEPGFAGPSFLGRLDRPTSGLVVAALTREALRAVEPGWRAGAVIKEYLAVVHGLPRPPAGEIALRLRRDPSDSRRVAASLTDGKDSRTGYRTLAASAGHGRSLLLCELLTGRMHQLRAHLAASGWPLVGDPVYGTGDHVSGPMSRQALHAWRVSVQHPADGRRLAITAPLPPDMAALLDELGFAVPGMRGDFARDA
jgi:23S rRNA pseudouridine1911/1915/1917 synthase